MKRIFFILLLFAAKNSFTQNIPDSIIYFEGVVSVDSTSQKELSIRARKWFSDNFKSPKDVLQIVDLENGEVTGNGSISYIYRYNVLGKKYQNIQYMNVSIKISTKDNKYKYKVGPFSPVGLSYNISTAKTHPEMPEKKPKSFLAPDKSYIADLKVQWVDLQDQTDKKGKLLVLSLQSAMAKSTKNDW